MLSDPIKFYHETVPCELCGKPTRMLGTKRCDGCWELETRIGGDVSMTLKIFKLNHNMKILLVEHVADCPFIRSVSEVTELQGGDCGFVCDILRLEEGGRARCNSSYPPRYCPLRIEDVIITIKRD